MAFGSGQVSSTNWVPSLLMYSVYFTIFFCLPCCGTYKTAQNSSDNLPSYLPNNPLPSQNSPFLKVFPYIVIYPLLRLSPGIRPLGVWQSMAVRMLVSVAHQASSAASWLLAALKYSYILTYLLNHHYQKVH